MLKPAFYGAMLLKRYDGSSIQTSHICTVQRGLRIHPDMTYTVDTNIIICERASVINQCIAKSATQLMMS